MDPSDRFLVPCLVASLVVNGLGVLVVSNASVFDPSRRPPPPAAAPETRRYTEIPRQPTPTPPPTPMPVVATPTPPPAPVPPLTPTPAPKPTPLVPPKPTPTPWMRPQASTSTPRPNQPVANPHVPLMNLGLGNPGKHGDVEISRNEVKSDLPAGTKANTTEHVNAPVKQEPTAIAPPPTPAPAIPGPPPMPKTTPPPPPSPPPTPAPVVRRATISSEPAVPLNGWDSITGSISVGEDFGPSQLRRKSVIVSIDTDANGDVKNVSITQSCGVSGIDDQIRKNCYKQHYKPPTQDGVALPSHFEHTFNLSF